MARRADRQRTTAQARAGPKGGRRMCGVIERKVKARSSPGAVDTPTDCLEQKRKTTGKTTGTKQKVESRIQTTNRKHQTSSIKHQTADSMQQGADSRKLNTGGWELGRTRNKREASAHVGSIAGAPPGRAHVLR